MNLTVDKRLNIAISDDLHRRFKIYCIQHGLDMTTAIRQFIEKAVSTTKPKEKSR